jgi:type II secretory pathway component GspD/PulD (secretin)
MDIRAESIEMTPSGTGGSSGVSAGDRKEVNIQVKFFEIDESKDEYGEADLLLTRNVGMRTNATSGMVAFAPVPGNGPVWLPAVSNAISIETIGTLSKEQFKAVEEKLQQCDGVDELTAPSVTTLSGRTAQITVVDITNIVTSAESKLDDAGKTVTAFKTTEVPLGPMVDLLPIISEDGMKVEVTVTPSVVEFMGYDKDSATVDMDGRLLAPAQLPLPHFRMRQMTADVSVASGNTIVLSGRDLDRAILKDKVPVLGDVPLMGRLFRSTTTTLKKRRLVVFVTPTIINANGMAVLEGKRN